MSVTIPNGFEADCPHCGRWTDQGPIYSDDGQRMRWECGECGDGPSEWHALDDFDGACADWNTWAQAQAPAA